jgi:hypothetical protein
MRVGPAPEELRRNSVGNWGPKDLSLFLKIQWRVLQYWMEMGIQSSV